MKSVYAALLVFLSLSCFAQDAVVFSPDTVKREITATRIQNSLRVDGRLDEPEWKQAVPAAGFLQIDPFQGQAPRYGSSTMVLFNRQFLYFGIIAQDSGGSKTIRATDFKRDFNVRSHDHVGISLDGFNDHRNAMAFFSNAYGVQRDMLVFDDVLTDLDWDALWKVRTTRTDTAWFAEIAIPWQTLRYPKENSGAQTWGINLVRSRRLNNEISAYAPYPRSFSFTRMEYAAVLKNLQPPPPRTNIRLQPYVLTSYDQYKNFPPTTDPQQNKWGAGGEIKWAINSNNILDLTLNTDFAQADADRQVNNVTRFSVFFPERRQFFLENASLFSAGVAPADDMSGGSMRIQPFFSRRIGLDESGNPIPIDAGGRYVHRSSKRNFGIIAMKQRKKNNSPGTAFFAGRYSENIGRRSRLGGLVTIKTNNQTTNLTGAADGFFRMGKSHSLSTMLMVSSDHKEKQSGVAGFAQYYYTSNQWKMWWTQTIVSKNFNPGMGFVSRNDIVGTTPGVFWYYRGKKLPLKKIIRAFEPGLMIEFYQQASTGMLLERQINMNPVWFNFQNGGYFGYLVNPVYQRLTEPFSPVGILISEGKYHYVRHSFYYSSDASAAVGISANAELGSYFNGKLNTMSLALRVSPSPYLSVTAEAHRNSFIRVGDEARSMHVDLWSLNGRFAINPQLQLTGFFQHNSVSKQNNYNFRLSWEYRPLSFIYLVYNHRSFDNTQLKRQLEDHLIFKIGYLLQL